MPSMSSLVANAAATPYPGSYNTVPLQTNIRPNDPPRPNNEAYVPLQFDWSALVAQAFPNPVSLSFLANVGLAPGALDYVRCLGIDNSYCEFDVHIQFLDGFTLTIPAWEPYDVYPVITTQKAFYIWCDSPTPVTAPTSMLAGRHSTTNVFVSNANIPPIRAKQQRKQNYTAVTVTAAGTYSLAGTAVGTANVYATELLIRGFIINNSSVFGSGGAIGLTIQLDGNTFFQAGFFGNPAFSSNNPTQPLVIPDLNIRAGIVNAVITAGSITTLFMVLTTIFIDHTGGYALT